MLLEEDQGLRSEVEAGLDPKSLHFGGRRRPDAVKLPDWQGLHKFRPHLRSDDEEPVRLAVIRGQFGEELVVGDAGRSRELGFGSDLARISSAI